MTGVNPTVLTHKLNMDPVGRPIQQKKRMIAPDRYQLTIGELNKLLNTNLI